MMLSGLSSVGDLVTRFLFLPSWCVIIMAYQRNAEETITYSYSFCLPSWEGVCIPRIRSTVPLIRSSSCHDPADPAFLWQLRMLR